MAKPVEAPRRGPNPAIARAKAQLERVRASAGYQRAKAAAVRRRKPLVAFGAGALYEMATARNMLPKFPIPLSSETQHAIMLAMAADRTTGMVSEMLDTGATGLAFSAGRRLVNTGTIGGPLDEVYI